MFSNRDLFVVNNVLSKVRRGLFVVFSKFVRIPFEVCSSLNRTKFNLILNHSSKIIYARSRVVVRSNFVCTWSELSLNFVRSAIDDSA